METPRARGLYVRRYGEVREILLERLAAGRNPMDHVSAAERAPSWTARYARPRALGRRRSAPRPSRIAQAGLEAEDSRRRARRARREYLAAFGLFRVARYPAPNSPAKQRAYRRSQDAYFKAARIRGARRAARRDALCRRPGPPARPSSAISIGRAARDALPVVVQWGGIDSFKEDRKPEPYLAAGFAVLAMDMPGVGDAPIPGSERGEELWNGVFDWIAAAPGLDERRIAVVGASTGGYWATKLAHTHRDRIAAAVNHGGPAHYAFQADWIARASRGEYPFELAETLACALRPRHRRGMAGVRAAPLAARSGHSWIGRSAPLLCVNGVDDSIFPIADMYLLLRHGNAKCARFFPGGHMGHDAGAFSHDRQLARSRSVAALHERR